MKKQIKHIQQFFTMLSFLFFNYATAQQTCNGSIEFTPLEPSVQLPLSNQYYTDVNGGFTWECWFKLSSVPGTSGPRMLINAVDGAQFEDIYLGFGWSGGFFNAPNNTLIFRVDPPSGLTPVDPNCSYLPSSGFAINQWYHVAGVIDYQLNKKYLYVDGVLVDTQPATVAVNTRVIQTNLSACGVCGNVGNLDGKMDEVRIWDRPRTASEIASNWQQCLSGTEANLFLYYRCNQSGALSILDATTNLNNGSFSNNIPSWSVDNAPVSGIACAQACNCLGSLSFNTTTNPSVELPLNNQYYTDANGGYTWETWFKLNSPLGNEVRVLISAVDWTTYEDNYFGFGWTGGVFNSGLDSLVFRVEGPGSLFPADQSCKWAPVGGFIVGQWYHAAGVADYSNSQKRLYVDGVLVSTENLTVPVNPRVIQTNLSTCGVCPGIHSLDGNMDEVRIWDRALTTAEINSSYQNCRNGNEPNLLVYYRCNQVGAPNVFDGSVNGNTGLFSVSPGWSTENAPVSGVTCNSDCNRDPKDPEDPKDSFTTGIGKLNTGTSDIQIYPNPSSGSIKVSSEHPGILNIFSVSGQLLSEIKVDKKEQEIKLQGLKSGIYLYVFSSESSTRSGKLIVE